MYHIANSSEEAQRFLFFQIMSSLNAEDVAKKVYSQLFHSMGDVQLEKLMGKWYTVSEEQTRPFRGAFRFGMWNGNFCEVSVQGRICCYRKQVDLC